MSELAEDTTTDLLDAPTDEQVSEELKVTDAEQETSEDNDADEDVVVTIGEEAPPAEEDVTQAPTWVKDLRKSHREMQRENRELKEKLKIQTAEVSSEVVLGAKPKLEDHDYDADKYEDELSKWYDRKRLADEQAIKVKAEQDAQKNAWQERLDSYGKAKTELKVKDYEDAEVVVQEVLSKTQQGIILQGADNPALVVYALGKNPAKAKELASIKDPVKYAFAVAKLETQLKISQRKAPAPEGTVSKGSGSVSGSVDSTLERLRAEAAKTGDYTKVVRYKASKRS